MGYSESAIMVFPNELWLGDKNKRNEFTPLLIEGLVSQGAKVVGFGYFRALSFRGPLLINWPEYLGTSTRFKGCLAPLVYSWILLNTRRLLGLPKTYLVHHNRLGQRDSRMFCVAAVRQLSDKCGANFFVSSGVDFLPNDLKNKIAIPHLSYAIKASLEKRVAYDVFIVKDSGRPSISTQKVLAANLKILIQVRDELIAPEMLSSRRVHFVLGKLSEHALQDCIWQAKAVLVPWIEIKNSGLLELASQLRTPALIGDPSFQSKRIDFHVINTSAKEPIQLEKYIDALGNKREELVKKNSDQNSKIAKIILSQINEKEKRHIDK